MGAILSAIYSGGSSDKSPRITEFHSEQEWKNRLDASKRSESTVKKIMMVTFTASWDGPGKFMEPVVRDLASKCGTIEFVKLDVDELPDAAKEFGIDVMPTFVVVKDGKESKRVVGAHKDELMKLLKEYLY